ncbi:B3 domain-containing protein Os07g0563300-like isoform X1 [Solanum tuberosum]|uniref:B3 domain-containing protein Os07g0563300-like isoform X1 n=1 Tax=Solanum tuberosum TaxID=4113 RepID=UPI0003D25E5F|nr:PREDICTED: B3 domain-containing protein Os07g0563300-like isoform X1 [Solanum tuberosum]
MASPSSSTTTFCFQCEDSSNSVTFRNGWRLRSGKFAQLCHRCASVYEYGRFCVTFHSSDDGWRDCESCGKLIHCGCIVSFNSYLLLDFGGIMCMECSKKNFILARNRCLSHETPVLTEESQLDATQTVIEPQYRPRVTESKLQKISINCGRVVTPLFQKSLSASDADLALSRLVIPKKCAEAYFPPLSGPHKIPINILDTDGKEWNFHFRFWPNSRSKMYVLEGLRDYMVSKKWQAGDVVTFYRIEPGQKLVMGLKNTSAGSSAS